MEEKDERVQKTYIHYRKENFLQNQINLNYSPDVQKIQKIYKRQANVLKNSMQELENFTGNNGGKSIIEALGLQQELSDIEQGKNFITNESIIKLTKQIREGLIETKKISKNINTFSNSDITKLDNYITLIKKVIANYNKCNKDFLSACLALYEGQPKKQQDLEQIFQAKNGLQLLNVNKSALTSLQSLKNSIEQLDKIKTQIQSGEQEKTVTYFSNTQQKEVPVSYSAYLYRLSYLFTNILGGIGEGVGIVFAFQKLDDFFTKEKSNLNFTIKGTGTQTTQKQGKATTKKADYEIEIMNDSAKIKFGISAKAQHLKRDKKTRTYFQTSKLQVFMSAAKLSKVEKYLFYNSLYHNINNDTQQYLRRRIAASNLLNAITGKKQGENVLFLQYLDGIVRLDDFFQTLGNNTELKAFPSLSISGINTIKRQNNSLQDLSYEEKTRLAYQSSKDLIKQYNNLLSQLFYEH